jgi:hypothetical protein
MTRRNKDKGRLPPFVPLINETIDSPAWRAMSPSARCVYIALRRRYSQNFRNNGKLYLSTRKAAEEVGLDRKTAMRGFQEIQHYGFGVVTTGACLGVEGKGKAPHWRLTEIGYMADPPTKDFLGWNGVVFEPPKNRIPVQKFHQPGPKNGTPVVPKTDQSSVDLVQKLDHRDALARSKNRTITSLTTRVARAGSELRNRCEHEPCGAN